VEDCTSGSLEATARVASADERRHCPSSPLAEDVQTLTALLPQFRQWIDDPLLALPDPKVVRRRLFRVTPTSVRRSRRIAAKGSGLPVTALKRVQKVLMEKLGICRDNERITSSQLADYAAIFASPLGPHQVEAITALFGLTCPTVAEELLVDAGAV
jgi:hypothetical protein